MNAAKQTPTQGELLYKLLHAAFHVADDCEENARTGAVTYLGGAKGTNDLGDMGTGFFELGLESHEDIREFCNSFASLSAQNERLVEALKAMREAFPEARTQTELEAIVDADTLLSPSRGDGV